MPLLNEVSQRGVIRPNNNQVVFLRHRKNLADCHFVQKKYLALMKVLNARIRIIEDEDVAIGANALQDAMCGRFIDPDRVAR